jgi:hypothetical protein
LTVSPASGSNNGSIALNVTANTSTAARTGTITVSGGGLNRTISVTQAGLTSAGITLTQNNTSATANVGNGISGRTPITVTAPFSGSVTVTLIGPGGWSNSSDPALFNSAGTRIAYQNHGWGFTHTLTLNAGQSWSGFIGTGGNEARSYTVTSTWVTSTSGITLTRTSPSATVNVGAGINGRVPVTITAPSNGSVVLRGTAGTTNANDPALYNAAGTIIAFQNHDFWNFSYTIPAGQTITVFAGTGWDVARSYIITATFP